MDHVAIMRKEWRMIPKILSGEKVIESRWYALKSSPWGKINPGDTVYFKNAGDPVTIRATVGEVISFSDLTPEKVRRIIDEYGEADGISSEDAGKFTHLFQYKKYCMLIFLENPEEITPFHVDKTGFGSMCAWMVVENVKRIKRSF